MSYLKRHGLSKPNYDKTPSVTIFGYEKHAWKGWKSVSSQIAEKLQQCQSENPVLAIECYTGLHHEEISSSLTETLLPQRWIYTEESIFKSEDEIENLVARDLGGDDPIFGQVSRLTMLDFIDSSKLKSLKTDRENWQGLTIIYGPGASLCSSVDCLVYADMPRWEGQLRQRRNEVSNLGVNNNNLKASLKYKRSFFIDWRVCDKLRQFSLNRWDYYLDTVVPETPKLMTGEAFQQSMRQVVQQPFRVVPFFDPGIWGGQWMRDVLGLPEGPPNYAWCFDCVPEENSLLLNVGDVQIETPSINVVFCQPDELMGEPVHGLFGTEFPIRFDLLDTMKGQNLSFQVHPLVDYAYENFGLRITQDESYYILDAEEDAEVFLGLKEGVDPTEMLEDLKTASENPDKPFSHEKHVASFPARRHDHFLIPAGTCHCSGANSMVLEISHTPYIFTFKMWDWERLDLNGQPRPINLSRAEANIKWNRTEKWVKSNLVNPIENIAMGEGWREERTGLYQSQFIETRRHWFTKKVLHDTKLDSVHVLNLIQGAEAIVESPTNKFNPFTIHFAETFIIPAAVGEYTIRPSDSINGQECATIKAYIRTNP